MAYSDSEIKTLIETFDLGKAVEKEELLAFYGREFQE